MDAVNEFWLPAAIATMVMVVIAALFILRRQVLREGLSEPARMARALVSARKAAGRGSPDRKPRKWVRGQMRLAMLLGESGGRNNNQDELEESAAILAKAIPLLEGMGLTGELATAMYYRGRAEMGLGNKALDTAGLEAAYKTLEELLAVKPWPRHLLRSVIMALSGASLIETGERLDDIARMEAGVSLCREAAKVARKRIRIEWCITHRILGHALGVLGRRKADPAMLGEAVEAAREAVGAIKPASDPYQWMVAQAELGFALAALGELKGDAGMLEESVLVLEKAMLASGPGMRASGKTILARNAGFAGVALGRLNKNHTVLRTAVDDLRSALAAHDEAGHLFARAEVAQMLGEALAELGGLEDDEEARREAQAHFSTALETYIAAGSAKQAEECKEALRGLENR